MMDRFFSKIKKSRGCWNWTASKNQEGYGNFVFNGRIISAHRFSWFLHNGDIPAEMCILHKCDNPPCVNPKHLFIGTKQDNANDAKAKGRTMIFQSNAGEKNPAAILNWKVVNRLRELFTTGNYTREELRNKFNIKKPTMDDLISGRTWSIK